ncbi:MAG: hypothetical protein COX65_02845 [Elusimicrobia bacterium CG_4_10_14_0_2_um_filter_56_8]|nr:MAG: hypothetical protein AUJ51_06860 [Elusimicrobia bacterium CG1_02_56_21]PJA16282.1 MAG: hypothetical protein COX65_02845 [Elusimicrobia bacterium CG_4_10_14_0_2_um_filter_56_8]
MDPGRAWIRPGAIVTVPETLKKYLRATGKPKRQASNPAVTSRASHKDLLTIFNFTKINALIFIGQ